MDQVIQFADEDQLGVIELSQTVTAVKSLASDGLLDAPTTAPQNNSSTILGAVYDNKVYLFTADAGVEALNHAMDAYNLEGLDWMQLPHHGSRHNIDADLISRFRPDVAYVSAPGSKDHPRQAVVNAFKNEGTSVYSTHYPNGANIWKHIGNVPPRSAYTVTATPLWDAT